MNFLQICQRLTIEAGIGLSGPASVSGNDGTELQRVVNWANDAYSDIQLMRDDWAFMRVDFSLSTVASTGDYTSSQVAAAGTPSTASVSHYSLEEMRCYLQSSGVSDEQRIWWIPYTHFKNVYRFSTSRTTEGRPQFFTLAPNKSIMLSPIPDAAYSVTGTFFRGPDSLSSNADEPIFDSSYHMAIVWHAVMKYAGFEETASAYVNAQNQLAPIMSRMHRIETPEVLVGGEFA